ncbi:MAG TPA: ABC transporter substrate-binding protein [Thermoleophilaceae bacterium]
MRTNLGPVWTRWILVIVAAFGLSLFTAACGGDDDDNGGGGGGGGGESFGGQAKTAASKCGLGNKKPATGEPIKIGAINTKQPGTDFSEIGRSAKAYFDCVNDNGGINGRPVQMILETEATDPAQAAAAAKKLVETDKVAGLVGNSSIIECAVNHKYYEANDYYVIGAGIAPECYGTSNFASVNMGPRHSVTGAAQYLIRQDVDKMVLLQSKVPGTEYIEGGFLALAKQEGVDTESLAEPVPIQDANSVALRIVQAAGQNGGVLLNFTPPEALKILQAAAQQGLEDRVKAWACSTPCNTDFLAKALGGAFDGKLGVNAELNLISADEPDTNLYKEVLKQYGKGISLGSFSQMGFLDARIATEAMLGIKGDVNKESVNEALEGVKGFKTDLLCKPWYYGDGPLHIPNNTDRTVTPKGDTMVIKEDCFEVSDADAPIKRVRDLEKKEGIYQPVGG